ncbi:MAG: phosphatidylserine/phosphatidylglycerophosphate/cardiolipin synthase family protein [Spirochaetia bacterium]|nr:phosphatidylserine/phosphatidylglycerophosphate/cardiolipin synthase family protein [Spirochaetia bacterium]MCF7940862.1 phosphatidylserine/phosphatidylglycerophosphate/cardiolipin synthase family protein [Spirochaetia bacterium]
MKPIQLFTVFALVLLLSSCTSIPRDDLPVSESIAAYYDDAGYQQFRSTVPVTCLDGASWLARAQELVDDAQDYILVDAFLANYTELTQGFYHALNRKQQEGVRVYVLYDASSNMQAYPDKEGYAPPADRFLRESGIAVTEYNPLLGSRFAVLPMFLDRDHRKFMIVDGEIIALGGINMNYSSHCFPEGRGHIDSMTEFSSAGIITAMISSFVETWNAYSVNRLDEADFAVAPDTGDSSLWLFDQGRGDSGVVDTMIKGLFSSAREEVWMIQSFAFLTRGLLRQIEQLEERGVDVHIIYSDISTADQYLKAAKFTLLDLIDVGADAYFLDAPDDAFTHLKFFAVDDTAVSLGSTNYNLRSYVLSRELAIVSTDPRFVTYTWQWFSEMQSLLRPVTRDEAATYRGLSYRLYYLFMLYGG